MRVYFLALFAAVLLFGCGTVKNDMSKMDAPLRAELRKAQEDALIGILLRLDEPVEAHTPKLVADGLQLQSVTGAIVTARGSRDSILRAADRSFVSRIELSQDRPGSHP